MSLRKFHACLAGSIALGSISPAFGQTVTTDTSGGLVFGSITNRELTFDTPVVSTTPSQAITGYGRAITGTNTNASYGYYQAGKNISVNAGLTPTAGGSNSAFYFNADAPNFTFNSGNFSNAGPFGNVTNNGNGGGIEIRQLNAGGFATANVSGVVTTTNGFGIYLQTINGAATLNLAGSVNATGGSGATVATSGSGNVVVNGAGIVTADGAFGILAGNNATSTGSVTVSGTLTVTATGANATGIQATIINAANSQNISVDSGAVSFQGGTGFGINASTTGTGTITIAGSQIGNIDNAGAAGTGTGISASAASGNISITLRNGTRIGNVGAAVATGVNATTNGTATITNNANIYAATSGIKGSNINLTMGATGTVVSAGNALDFTGGTNTVTFANTTTGLTGDIANAGALTFNQAASGNVTIANTITGAGTFTVLGGANTVTLTGTNTFSGTLTISTGTLQVGAAGTAGTLGTGSVVNNASLTFNRTDTTTVANAISGTGTLTQNGTGTVTLTGALSYTGTTTVTAGSLVLGDATNAATLPGAASVTGGTLAVANGSLGSGTISVSNGQSVLVGLTAGLTATAGSSTITGDGTVTFQNSGSAGTATINSTGLVDFADTSTAGSATISITGGGIGQLRGSASGGSATFTVGAGSSLTLNGNTTLGTARIILNAGTLDISPHNLGNVVAGSIQGNGDIGLGGNTLEAGGNNASTTYSGVMSGTGGLEKKGTGNLILTGTNSYTGNTNVSGGTLSVNGSITSSAVVFVNNGGTLGGNGTVSTTLVNNGGTIAPGNSIGTLNVNGDVTFGSGSTYSVEVNSAGVADKLVATGSVTINAGATLAVKPFNVGETGATYGATTTYAVITAAGGVTGTFSNVTDTFAFLDATLAYAANSVTLTLKRNDTAFASVGYTPNQRAAAAGVSSLGAGTIYGAILGLSASDARAAFDLLSGEVHASVETALIEDSRFARDAVNSRMIATRRGAAETSRNIWIQGFGAYGTWASDGNAAAMARSTGGFLVGSDGEAFDDVTAGLFAGYSRTGLDVSARRSSATIDSYQVGAYGGTSFGELAFRFMSAYTFHDIGTARSVGFTGFNDALTGRYRAGTGQVFGEVSYDFRHMDGSVISPFANLAYVRLDSSGFREIGGAAALSSGANFANTLLSTVGVSGRTTLEAGSLPVELSARVGWRHAAGNVGMDRALNFANGATFTVGGVPVGRDTAVVDAQLDIMVTPVTSLSLRYSGQMGSGVSDHSLNARFDMRF